MKHTHSTARRAAGALAFGYLLAMSLACGMSGESSDEGEDEAPAEPMRIVATGYAELIETLRAGLWLAAASESDDPACLGRASRLDRGSDSISYVWANNNQHIIFYVTADLTITSAPNIRQDAAPAGYGATDQLQGSHPFIDQIGSQIHEGVHQHGCAFVGGGTIDDCATARTIVTSPQPTFVQAFSSVGMRNMPTTLSGRVQTFAPLRFHGNLRVNCMAN